MGSWRQNNLIRERIRFFFFGFISMILELLARMIFERVPIVGW
jgi:hypothetical protein